MQRNTFRSIVRFLFRALSTVHLQGVDRVPAQGGVILAVNHLSRVDSPLVYSMLERPDATALIADTYQKNPFFRYLVNLVGGVWINRDQADLGALREALELLQSGGALGVAPEGARSRSHALKEGKTGAAYLADKARVPVIPVAVWGTEDAIKNLIRLKRPHIYMRVGEPFCLPPLDRRDRNAGLERNTEEIMCRIAALLPPEYRGMYADHPRLQALLAEENEAEGPSLLPEPIHLTDND